MNTKILEYIVAIADEGSLSKAAERFYLSHAALSQHIKNIEAELGTPLFERNKKGMIPTHAGSLYINDARAILHEEMLLEQDLAEMRRRQQKRIRVMADSPFYNTFLQKILPRFRELHPEYTVETISCNSAQAVREVRNGTAQLAIVTETEKTIPGLTTTLIHTDPLRLVFPKSYTGPTNIGAIPAVIEAGMFPILYPVGTTVRTIEEICLTRAGLLPSVILESNFHSAITHITQRNCCSLLIQEFCDRFADQLTVGDTLCNLYMMAACTEKLARLPACQDMIRCVYEVYNQ